MFLLSAAHNVVAIFPQSNWLGPVPAAPEHTVLHERPLRDTTPLASPIALTPTRSPEGRERWNVVTIISGNPFTGMRLVEPISN